MQSIKDFLYGQWGFITRCHIGKAVKRALWKKTYLDICSAHHDYVESQVSPCLTGPFLDDYAISSSLKVALNPRATRLIPWTIPFGQAAFETAQLPRCIYICRRQRDWSIILLSRKHFAGLPYRLRKGKACKGLMLLPWMEDSTSML